MEPKVFIPVVNSIQGLSLTAQQWQDLGIQYYGFDVLGLLQRPGYPCAVDLKTIFKVPGYFIIDARQVAVQNQHVSYRKPNGCLEKISWDVYLAWMQCWCADKVLLPGDQVPAQWQIQNDVAIHAAQGVFYTGGQQYSILDTQFQNDFSVLSIACDCESCDRGLTRAYLHHLQQHVPLLAQRQFMMHNMRQMVLGSCDLQQEPCE